jgi:hypothetical protein
MPDAVLDNPRYGLQSADLGARAASEKLQLKEELDRLRGESLSVRCLDLPRLEALLDRLAPETAWEQASAVGCILLRGLNAGIFLAASDPARISATSLVPP